MNRELILTLIPPKSPCNVADSTSSVVLIVAGSVLSIALVTFAAVFVYYIILPACDKPGSSVGAGQVQPVDEKKKKKKKKKKEEEKQEEEEQTGKQKEPSSENVGEQNSGTVKIMAQEQVKSSQIAPATLAVASSVVNDGYVLRNE